MNTLIKNQVEGAKIISKASSSNGNAGSGMADEALRAMSKNVQNNRSIAPPPAQGHGGNNTNISKGNDPSATHQKAMQMAMGGQMAAG